MYDLGVLGFSRAQRRLLRELRLRAIFHPGRVVSARGGRLSDCPCCPTRPNLEHAHADLAHVARVIGGPSGCFALTMPRAYRPALRRVIFTGEHRALWRTGREGPRLNRAAHRCDGPAGFSGLASAFTGGLSPIGHYCRALYLTASSQRRTSIGRNGARCCEGPARGTTRWPPLTDLQHLLHRRRNVRLASARNMAARSQFSADLAIGYPPRGNCGFTRD